MRTTCLVPLLFVAACGHHTPASATPTSEQRHLFAVEDRSIAQTSDARLIGVSVGRTRLVITLIGKKALAHAPPSYVPVIVLP